jgi:hypothetical protein
MPEYPEGPEDAIKWINEGIKVPHDSFWQLRTDTLWQGKKCPGWTILSRERDRVNKVILTALMGKNHVQG